MKIEARPVKCSMLICLIAVTWMPNYVVAGPPSTSSEGKYELDLLLKAYVDDGATVTLSLRFSGKDSVLDGPFRIIDRSGALLVSGAYSNGGWQGDLTSFHTNGVLSSREYYLDGKPEGVHLWYGLTGQPLRLTTFKSGEKNGPERYWSSNGALLSRLEWKQGHPIWLELYEKGQTNRLTGDPLIKYFREKSIEAAEESLKGKDLPSR
jgi:hypothetical protein